MRSAGRGAMVSVGAQPPAPGVALRQGGGLAASSEVLLSHVRTLLSAGGEAEPIVAVVIVALAHRADRAVEGGRRACKARIASPCSPHGSSSSAPRLARGGARGLPPARGAGAPRTCTGRRAAPAQHCRRARPGGGRRRAGRPERVDAARADDPWRRPPGRPGGSRHGRAPRRRRPDRPGDRPCRLRPHGAAAAFVAVVTVVAQMGVDTFLMRQPGTLERRHLDVAFTFLAVTSVPSTAVALDLAYLAGGLLRPVGVLADRLQQQRLRPRPDR